MADDLDNLIDQYARSVERRAATESKIIRLLKQYHFRGNPWFPPLRLDAKSAKLHVGDEQ